MGKHSHRNLLEFTKDSGYKSDDKFDSMSIIDNDVFELHGM